MKINSDKRYNILKPNKIIFSTFFLVSLVFFILLPHPFRSKVQVELISDVRSIFKIYWADSKTSYNEAESKAVVINKGRGVYSIDINNLLYSLKFLRIDPLISPGNVCIKRIEITQFGFKPIVFEKMEQFEKFVPLHHIGNISFQNKGLQITSVGNDPYLHIKIKPVFKILLLLKHILYSILSASLVTSIYYLLYRIA